MTARVYCYISSSLLLYKLLTQKVKDIKYYNMQPNNLENEGLETLASLCNKASMSNDDQNRETNSGAAPRAGCTEANLQQSLDANSNRNMFQTSQGINPDLISFINSLGSQISPHQLQSLMASKLSDPNQISFSQQLPSYFATNRQQIPNMMTKTLPLAPFPLGYDASLLNSMLLASQQGKTTEQNKNHLRGKNICSVRFFRVVSYV